MAGSVVRFTPGSVSFNTHTAVEDIYGSRKANVVKSDWYRNVQYTAAGYASTITITDRTRHATKRRLLSHAFSDSALREMAPRVTKHVQKWTKCLGKDVSNEWGSATEIGDWATYLTFDVLSDLCFGKPFNVMESDENRFLTHLIPEATKGWYTLGYHPFTQILRRILFKTPIGRIVGGKAFRDNKRFRLFCAKALRERRQAEAILSKSPDTPEKDFFHYLLNGRDPETGLGYAKGELEAESVLLVVAGSDSAAAALSACFFYLVRNEECLAKLTAEVRSSFSSAEGIQWTRSGLLANLPYLRACIDESLRMTPPTPGHLPREVLPGGATIDGNFYPAGTIVGASAYVVHHNPEYFPDPFKFYPERWIVDPTLTGVTSESVAVAQSAFCPFSAGTRGCIGKHLAYMELSLALSRTLWLYDIRAKPGDTTGQGASGMRRGRKRPTEYQVEDVFLVNRKGPVVEFRFRKESQPDL